jgi:hypothetical protein
LTQNTIFLHLHLSTDFYTNANRNNRYVGEEAVCVLLESACQSHHARSNSVKPCFVTRPTVVMIYMRHMTPNGLLLQYIEGPHAWGGLVDISVELIAFCLIVGQIVGSNLCPDTGYTDRGLSCFESVTARQTSGQYLKLGLEIFLSHPF